jgi:hypothetical protein
LEKLEGMGRVFGRSITNLELPPKIRATLAAPSVTRLLIERQRLGGVFLDTITAGIGIPESVAPLGVAGFASLLEQLRRASLVSANASSLGQCFA